MELIGRQWEIAGADRFLDDISAGPAAMLLEGDPGIGKTTVWRAAVDAARRRSYRVLVCRASESESALSFLGLGDLLDGVAEAVLDALPEPQRRALEFALLRSSDEGSLDRVAVARGTLAVIRASASETPTVLAIDDVQWLDAPSADVCRFVAHRLTEERVGLLLSVREAGTSPLELDQAFPGGKLVRLRLEALELDELEEVVRLHLPVSFSQPTWQALYQISGGNPFFALQLAEALERRGSQPLGEGLPIPKTLAEAMRERLAVLSAVARSTLLPVAALAQPTLSLLREAATEPDGVEEAVQAGVLQVDGERVRFTHPLLGSFVYGEASDAERRDVHRLLAALVTDREEHALHLARGTLEPDEGVASTLEATAEEAAKRGHLEVAVRARRARSPSDSGGARGRPNAACARGGAVPHRGRGRSPVARAARELVAQLPASEERARVLTLLAYITGDISRSIALFEDALAETGEDLELQSQILSFLCWQEGMRDRWDAAVAARPRSGRARRAFGEPGGARREPGPAGLERAQPGPDADDRARGGAGAVAQRAAAVGSQPELRPRDVPLRRWTGSTRRGGSSRTSTSEPSPWETGGDRSTSRGSRRSSSGPGTGRRHAPTRGERGSSVART